jgi:DNA recombination protein RmuC
MSFEAGLLGGMVLGALVGIVIMHFRAKAQMAALVAVLEQERKSAAEKLALVQQAETKLSDAFKAMSSEALRANNQSFLDLAKGSFETLQSQAKGDLEKRQQAIEQMVKPVQESLTKFDTRIQDIEKARVGAYQGLSQQVQTLLLTQQKLQTETTNLVKALGTPRVRGRWGEIQLRRVVEMAGMVNHCDFREQQNATTDDGRLRPDVIINLPGGKNIVVDAKAPLAAYLEAMEAVDDAARVVKLRDHARQIRDHIHELGKKSYWSQFEPAPEFVVLFLPGESFFSAALELEPGLIEEGVKERVILATPTTLISLLKAVSYGWRQERLAENARQISDLGRELYDRLRTMGEHFGRVGSSLESAVKHYNNAVGSLESRVLSSARKLKELEAAGTSKDIDPLEQIETQARSLPEDGKLL